MHLLALPRGSLPARLAVMDLISRTDSSCKIDSRVRQVVTQASRYLLDPSFTLSEYDLRNLCDSLAVIYKGSNC
jgi:hypothetical protein